MAPVPLEVVAAHYEPSGLTLADLESLRYALAHAEIDSRLMGGVVHIHDNDVKVASVLRDRWAREHFRPRHRAVWWCASLAAASWLAVGICVTGMLCLRAYQLAGPPSTEVRSIADELDSYTGDAMLAALAAVVTTVCWVIVTCQRLWRDLLDRYRIGILLCAGGLAGMGIVVAALASLPFQKDNATARLHHELYPTVQCVLGAAVATAVAVAAALTLEVLSAVVIDSVHRNSRYRSS